MSLGYDAGLGEGVWEYTPDLRGNSYIVKFLRIRELKEYAFAFTSPVNNNILAIALQYGQEKEMTKWAEKIARVLNLKIEYERNYIYLEFE